MSLKHIGEMLLGLLITLLALTAAPHPAVQAMALASKAPGASVCVGPALPVYSPSVDTLVINPMQAEDSFDSQEAVTPFHPILLVENMDRLPVHESCFEKGLGLLFTFTLKVEKFPVLVAFQDDKGNTLGLDQLGIPDPDHAVKVTLTYMDGAKDPQPPQEVTLQTIPGNRQLLRGYLGDQIERAGKYLVEIKVSTPYNQHRYNLVSDTASPVTVNRSDTFDRNPGFLHLIQGLAALVILVMLGTAAWLFTNPAQGELKFYRSGGFGPSYQDFASLSSGRLHLRYTWHNRGAIREASKILSHIQSIRTSLDGSSNGQKVVKVRLTYAPDANQAHQTIKLFALDRIDPSKVSAFSKVMPNTPAYSAHLPGGILVCFQQPDGSGKKKV